MQMAELLVSHGASLSARTSLDEMPIGELTNIRKQIKVTKKGVQKLFALSLLGLQMELSEALAFHFSDV